MYEAEVSGYETPDDCGTNNGTCPGAPVRRRTLGPPPRSPSNDPTLRMTDKTCHGAPQRKKRKISVLTTSGNVPPFPVLSTLVHVALTTPASVTPPTTPTGHRTNKSCPHAPKKSRR